MPKPTISVVMSVYNGKPYLSEAIESILNQTFSDFEFIIINDGSTDDSWQIIKQYAEKDKRIIPITQENIGLTKSLNKGIRVAKGKYIARQDADDISLNERFEKQYDYLKKNQNITFVGCLCEVINNCGNVLYKGKDKHFSKRGLKKFLSRNNLFMHGEVMFKKSNVVNVGMYREHFQYAQDYDLWLRLIHNYDFVIIPQILYRYRLISESISVSKYESQKYYAELAKLFFDERKENGKDSYDLYFNKRHDASIDLNIKSNSFDYLLRQAEELINYDNSIDAKKYLKEAWILGCRDIRIYKAYIKIFIGERILHIIRWLKNIRYRI